MCSPFWRIQSYIRSGVDGEQKFLKIVAQYAGDSRRAPRDDGTAAVKIAEGASKLVFGYQRLRSFNIEHRPSIIIQVVKSWALWVSGQDGSFLAAALSAYFQFCGRNIQLFTEPQDGCGEVAPGASQGLDVMSGILAMLIDEFQNIQLIVAQAFDDGIVNRCSVTMGTSLNVCVHFITNQP